MLEKYENRNWIKKIEKICRKRNREQERENRQETCNGTGSKNRKKEKMNKRKNGDGLQRIMMERDLKEKVSIVW